MKYTLITNGILVVNGINVELEEHQIIDIIISTGVTTFKCPFNDNFIFIEGTIEQIEELKEFSFVDGIDEYDESYFIVNDTVKQLVWDLDNLISIKSTINYDKDTYIKQIEEIEEQIKTLKNNG